MRILIKPLVFFSCLVLFIAFFTYFRGYWYPPALFWDENYHIVSAYKYLNHVMFMEPHPPLGKLFIALGEWLLHPNAGLNMDYALGTDYIKTIPNNFSFVGVRFFPALFGMLSSVLFFHVLYKIFKQIRFAFWFSALYVFENALILQSRSAMLESTQIFFILSALLWFLHLLERKQSSWWHYGILGLLAGAAISVKLNALCLVLLLPFLLHHEKIIGKGLFIFKPFLRKTLVFIVSILLVFCGSYYVHTALGEHAVQDNYYIASNTYKTILKQHTEADPANFPTIFADNVLFIPHYENGVPKYDPTKKDENGSLPYTWAFGNKTINYRWEKHDGKTQYLYLQGNPLVWLFGLVGIILGSCLVGAVIFFKLPITDKKRFYLIVVFLSLYVGYMVPMLFITRVLYLYLYLVPLIFSLLLGCSVFAYMQNEQLKKKDTTLTFGIAIFVLLLISTYLFFSPFTYYEPLTTAQFMQRSWLPFWNLTPIQ